MKRFFLLVISLVVGLSGWAQTQPEKTMVAVKGAYVVALSADGGWGMSLRQLGYLGKSDLYVGWVSTVATTGAVGFAEGGPVVGYAPLPIKGPNMDVSVALDLLSARFTALPALVLQSPALQVQLGLVLPVSQGFEAELCFSPVLHPYNFATARWDFSDTTFSMGVELRWGRYVTTQGHYWTDAVNPSL